MNKKINPYSAYVINETADGFYISDCHGFVFESEDLITIGENLIKYAMKHQKDLSEYNKARKIEFENEMNAIKGTTKQRKPPKAAYVYMLECGGKYKVGYSDNVERRVRQLNNRPFPLTIIAVSEPTIDAFEIEQYIHSKLKHLRIEGEWYEISAAGVERVKQYIENIS